MIKIFCLILVLPSLLLAANPLDTWLDASSTTDDHTIYLPGMDAANPPDADTLAMLAHWKIMIWSAGGVGSSRYGAYEAAHLKSADSTVKLLLYTSLDHGLRSISQAIDTTDTGSNNEWNSSDEYSHYRATAADSSESYYALFYHFAEETKIMLYPRTSGGYTYHDTVTFTAATIPISDDDSSSVVPDFYSSPYFTASGTLDTISVDTTGFIISRSFLYQGTPQGSKTTRVYPDFSNPLARWADLKYQLRAFAPDLNDLGGVGNDVYGWGPLSDSGYAWDGLFLDNSGDHQVSPPEGSTLISGGNILCSRGVIGSWYADATLDSMNAHMKEYFTFITDYLNNGANFSDGKARATAANFGTWKTWLSSRNPISQWYDAANKINLKCIENSMLDGGYSSYAAYESSAGNGRTMTELAQMDSLAQANDFYVAFSGRVDYRDTANASGWPEMKSAFMRSNWVRAKTAGSHRFLYATQPLLAFATTNPTPPPATVIYQPCNSGGFSYQGLNYSPLCNDRAEASLFVDACTLPFMWSYDMGERIDDSTAIVSGSDATGQTVNIWKTFWRQVTGSDTTFTWMYYFPRPVAWAVDHWKHTANHYVNVLPPSVEYRRLEYDGSLTEIAGVIQRCYMGDQLILSYTSSTPAATSGDKVLIRKTVSPCVGCEEDISPDPIP